MAEGQNPGNKMKMTRREVSPDILKFHILPRLPAKSVGRFRCVSKEWHSFLTTLDFTKMQLLHQNQKYDDDQKLLLFSPTTPYTFHILPRLTAKSVGRFRCVSREWHSFLTTNHFAKMQLHHLTNDDHQNHQKLLLLSTTTPYTFRTIDCETPNKDGLSASRPLPFGSCKTIPMSIVASLHGLVCIEKPRFDEEGHRNTDLILWNPLTSDYKTLSNRSSDDDCYHINYEGRFGLYYSTSDEDYKLLCVTNHTNLKLYIYSLKSDSWRKVETTNRTSSSNDMINSYIFNIPSVLLNEKVYFLKKKHINGQLPSYSIMIFDTKTEKMREIASPTLRNERKECMGLMVVRGAIHLYVAFTDGQGVYDHDHTVELWMMNGSDGDWTKLVTYSPIECFWRRDQKPLHIMRNGDWLMYINTERGHVLQRDMNKKNIGWKYMETLVSPNQYIN